MSVIRDFLMPDLGEGLTEGEILTWLVAEGDTVRVDQPIAEVSTEKAAVEVPTPFAGRVAKLHGGPGDMIKVGSPLISVETGVGAAQDGDAARRDGGWRTPGADIASPAGGAAPSAAGGDVKSDESSGNVLVGYGTITETPRRRSRTAVRSETEANAVTPAVWPPASPLVRRLAAQRGIDLAAVTGTGPGGMVTRADFDRATTTASGPAPATAAPGVARKAVVHSADGVTRQRLIGVDRVAAERLARSHREIPTAVATTIADATALLRLRAGLEWAGEGRVTPFALLLRCAVLALRRFPRLNAHFDAERNEIVLFDSVHVGVAVQTDHGLVVPVIRNAERLTPLQLAAALDRTATAARSKALSAAELTGSTFTVSNFGAFGVDGGAALINPPEVGILGVGRIAERPWVVDGAVQPRHVVELSLVFDHRVADGGVGGGYLKHLATLIEQPETATDD